MYSYTPLFFILIGAGISLVVSIVVFMALYTICVRSARLFLPQSDETEQRLSLMQEALKRQDHRMQQMERELQSLRSTVAPAPAERPAGGLSIGRMPQSAPQQEPAHILAPTEQLLYFTVPVGENALGQASTQREIGKSVYQLSTADGTNGTFVVIPDADAMATALLSLSQVLKPVCRVNTRGGGIPRSILTLEEGQAVREGNTWRVVRKAIIELQN